jgi:dTDP-4-amino-4,6-dideoxygalactose transaminase
MSNSIKANPQMSKPKSDHPRIFLSPPHMSGKEIEYVAQAFESNYIAPTGPQLDRFEEMFRELTGFEHCLAVVNGTSAIHLALRSLGVGPGDKVLASTLTFIGSVSPIVFQNAEIVFVDSDATWNLDPNLLEDELKRMKADNDLPKAVLPTELYGQACDLDRIVEICDRFDVPVVCDSAESLGASYRERAVGRGARAATFSFNGNKIITTSSGGMLASDDKELIDHCRYLATQARQPVRHYEHHDIGYNYRMSNVLAAIGMGQLEALPSRVERKREVFAEYQNRLGDLPGLNFMQEAEYGKCNRWLTVATIDVDSFGATPEEVILALEEENIESRPVWKPLHMQKAFSQFRTVGGDVARSYFDNGICLPSGAAMSTNDLDRICSIVRSISK